MTTTLSILIGFSLGFSCALLLILRVSMRPKVKTILRKAGVLRMHKAVVPKGKQDEMVDDWEDEKGMFV